MADFILPSFPDHGKLAKMPDIIKCKFKIHMFINNFVNSHKICTLDYLFNKFVG